MTFADFSTILPFVCLVGWGIITLLADLWIPSSRKGWTAILAASGLVVALSLTIWQSLGLALNEVRIGFSGMVVLDGFSEALQVIFEVSALAGIALAHDYLKRMNIERGEYYALLLFAASGMVLMAQAYDLIVVFLALELLSLPLYILAGFARPKLASEEAALKYFFLGAFSSGFILYGIALIYGATGTTSLTAIVGGFSASQFNVLLFDVGAALVLVGLGFKVAAVPFHMWAPDVYQGAPTPVTGFMSIGAKAAGFAALIRIFLIAFPGLGADLTPILIGLALLTMLVGNILAAIQINIKRLLAYASIASAGYLIASLVPYAQTALAGEMAGSMLFYLVAYAVTSIGAWSVVIFLERSDDEGLTVDNFSGLAHRHPWLALSMLVFLLSFTGIPLTLGFWGKFYLFRTMVLGGYAPLAAAGLLASVISAFYFLRIIVLMYMKPGDPQVRQDIWLGITTAVAALAVVVLAFFPNTILDALARAFVH